MNRWDQTLCTAFKGTRRIASGELVVVALKTKEVLDRGDPGAIVIFDDATAEPIELDFRGTAADVLRRLARTGGEVAPTPDGLDPPKDTARGPGRPKLGVVGREVTLLPRHWEWLNSQPGGASVALRKLVEEARRVNESRDRFRQSQEAAYRFMSAMAGNLPGFEEASRAFFASNGPRFDALVADWPADVRDYAKALGAVALKG